MGKVPFRNDSFKCYCSLVASERNLLAHSVICSISVEMKPLRFEAKLSYLFHSNINMRSEFIFPVVNFVNNANFIYCIIQRLFNYSYLNGHEVELRSYFA